MPGWKELRLGVGGVRQAWRRTPQANIGLLLHANDLLLIDLDGVQAVAEVSELGMPNAPTEDCDRAGGDVGLHVFLRRGDLPLRSLVHRGSSHGIDLKSEGLAVVPPSRRFTDGRMVSREWWPGSSILDIRPAPVPQWAVVMLNEAPAQTQAPATPDPVPGKAAGGGAAPQFDAPANLPLWAQALIDLGPKRFADRYPSRSEALFALVCAMVRAGWTDERIIADCLVQPWIAAMSDKHGNMRVYLNRDENRGLVPRARSKVAEEFVDW